MELWDNDSWWVRFADWLQDRPALSSVVLSLAGVFATFGLEQALEWGPSWQKHPTIMGTVGVLIVAVATQAVLVERTKTLRARRMTIKTIQGLLCQLAKTATPAGLHVRANIMLSDPARQRRTVDASTAYNMHGDGDTDSRLTIAFKSGVSGKAARFLKPVISPCEGDFGLDPEEQALVRRTLKTILSAPILDDDVFVVGANRVIGTLQLDSDELVEKLGWNEQTCERAQSFADIIALQLRHKS
jgi:hypothetical protein